MAIGRDTIVHLARPRGRRDPRRLAAGPSSSTPGTATRTAPDRPTPSRPLRRPAGHPRPRRPLGRRRPARRAAPARLAVHPRDQPVAVAPAPGGSDQVIGMNTGGTVEVAGLRSRWSRRSTPAATGSRPPRPRSTSGEPAGFVVELENGFRIYDAGDTRGVRRHGADPRAVQAGPRDPADRRPLHDGPGGRGASPSACSASTHVLPVHWGTFPILTGTPAALADAIAARGGTAEVIAWAPGDTID